MQMYWKKRWRKLRAHNFDMHDGIIYSSSFRDGENWEVSFPRKELMPIFTKKDNEISVESNGNPYMFGYWKNRVPVDGGKTYRFKVVFKIDRIVDVNLHVMNMILWVMKDKQPIECPHDHISNFMLDGEFIIGEQCFEAGLGCCFAEIQLGARFLEKGKVTWFKVELTEAEPVLPRIVSVAAVNWNPLTGGSLDANLMQIETFIDQAGALKSDVLVLPEFANLHSKGIPYDRVAEEVPSGRLCSFLSKKARENNVNVCTGMVEKDGDIIFNTAIVFDRKGLYIGKYRKVHPWWPDEFFNGESPGDGFPVFDLDFGRVGIIVCYDGWYGECVRLLALKGAEMVLSRRRLPHQCAGGTRNPAAGGRRSARNSMSSNLYDEINFEMKTWLNRPEMCN